MRTIGVVTSSRADYGIYQPVLRALQAEPDIRLRLFVTGMHLAPEFGQTVRAIEADGYEIAERVEMLLSSDSPEGISKSMGLGTLGFAQAYTRSRPDLLVVLGDRFEMHAAALAALPFKIPMAHLHGGEVTSGAIDDPLRHSMTKLSHLHFVSTPQYARRVEQLGEEPWRITVSGAPALDHLHTLTYLTPAELETRFGFRLTPPPLVVTFHPPTLTYEQTEFFTTELLAALDACGHPVIFTQTNADTGGRIIASLIEQYAQTRTDVWRVENMGIQAYFSLLRHALAMVGNSSSGLLEAPSFQLPVINIGDRQEGRVRARNVLDTPCEQSTIAQALARATSCEFRQSLNGLDNPYGDGHAADRIVERLKNVALDDRLIRKRFFDWPSDPLQNENKKTETCHAE
jgi:UDP-N-acetylglucosamine 2-epimerase (non-hydrolysing)/GDP/UDP-N,N'-diacetylbacillosamine 2-epimerase (hydrolysing)